MSSKSLFFPSKCYNKQKKTRWFYRLQVGTGERKKRRRRRRKTVYPWADESDQRAHTDVRGRGSRGQISTTSRSDRRLQSPRTAIGSYVAHLLRLGNQFLVLHHHNIIIMIPLYNILSVTHAWIFVVVFFFVVVVDPSNRNPVFALFFPSIAILLLLVVVGVADTWHWVIWRRFEYFMNNKSYYRRV